MLDRMATGTTPEAILAGNIAAARARRRLDQQDLADRMRALGWKWVRQTVGEVENNRRRLTAGEIIGLAACLDTTVHNLMSPLLQDGPVEFPSGASLTFSQVRSLLMGHGPGDDNPRSSVRSPRDLRGISWQENVPVFAHAEHPATRPISVEEALEQPIATAIVTSNLGVLVGRRNDGKPPWTFIAGEVEPGESPADAAGREVKEEAGLEVEVGEVIGERVHPRTGRTMIYMAARPTRGTEVIVGDEDELAEVRWVSLAEADELMAAYGMFEPVHEHLARELGE
jgi:8-oxo-dGTP pyrophosphatase MutT (NUDIX family)